MALDVFASPSVPKGSGEESKKLLEYKKDYEKDKKYKTFEEILNEGNGYFQGEFGEKRLNFEALANKRKLKDFIFNTFETKGFSIVNSPNWEFNHCEDILSMAFSLLRIEFHFFYRINKFDKLFFLIHFLIFNKPNPL